MCFDGITETFCLHILAEVNENFEIAEGTFGHALEISENGTFADSVGIPPFAVMTPYIVFADGGNLAVFGAKNGEDGIEIGHTVNAEFAVENDGGTVVKGILSLNAVVSPGTVDVLIAAGIVGIEPFGGTGRGCGKHENFGRKLFTDCLEHCEVFVFVSGRNASLIHQLVAAAPEGKGSVISLFGDDSACGLFAELQEFGTL